MITLATTVSSLRSASSPNLYLVFVHGLDSTRFTWQKCIDKWVDSYNMVALDLRGHGDSTFGREEDFSADMLVEDIRHTLREKNIPSPFVLIGHSMGGRVAMAYGAKFPQDLAGMVIEDMDIRLRDVPQCSDTDMENRRSVSENRSDFSTFDDLESSLSRWYEIPRIRSWKNDRRVHLRSTGDIRANTCMENIESRPESSSSKWWCGVNPLAQYHARKTVLAHVGEEEWKACGIGKSKSDAAGDEGKAVPEGQYNFPIHVFVAENKSACSADSVSKMASLVPNANIHSFPNAEHSIHRTDFEQYISKIENIVYPGALQYCLSQNLMKRKATEDATRDDNNDKHMKLQHEEDVVSEEK